MEKQIKAAHIAAFTPGRCGLYQTTREVILAERAVGIDARLIDCGNAAEVGEIKKSQLEMVPFFKNLGFAANQAMQCATDYLKSKGEYKVDPVDPGTEDDGVIVEDPKWVDECDIIIGHSGVPQHLESKNNIPYIMCCHGRPKSSFLLEWSGQYPVYLGYTKMNQNPKIVKFVTFWKEHFPQLSMIVDPKKIEYIPACVDLEKFNPKGEKGKFENMGEKNILICDIWREDIDPYNVVHASHYFCLKHKNWKFHVLGAKPQSELGPWNILLGNCQRMGTLGEISGLVKEIDKAYRTADMMLTPHRIATRTVRESLASGLPLVAEEGNPYTPFHAPTWHLDRFIAEMERCAKKIEQDTQSVQIRMRKSAEANFSLEATGKAMKSLIESTLNEWDSGIKDRVVSKITSSTKAVVMEAKNE